MGAADLLSVGDQVGYPLLVKASAGGGGKGMRVVRDPADLAEAVAGARREAQSSFGDPTVFLERYLERSRHVEVQVFGDEHGNVVHLFERECSIQRRHQKIVEESPSPGATAATLEAMFAAAVSLARAIGYVGAGTVEFLVSGEGDAQEFFFLEMNTRLQVEHPVTEMVTGLDLVAWQLAVARGEPLPLSQDEIERSGHAIEVRLYAEDPARDFLPSTGTLAAWDVLGVRRRLAAGRQRIRAGPGRLAVLRPHAGEGHRARQHAASEAAAGLSGYLRNVAVVGVATNQLALAEILDSAAFLDGDTTTAFLDEHPALLGAGGARTTYDARISLWLPCCCSGRSRGIATCGGAAETLRVGYREGADDVTAVLGRSVGTRRQRHVGPPAASTMAWIPMRHRRS